MIVRAVSPAHESLFQPLAQRTTARYSMASRLHLGSLGLISQWTYIPYTNRTSSQSHGSCEIFCSNSLVPLRRKTSLHVSASCKDRLGIRASLELRGVDNSTTHPQVTSPFLGGRLSLTRALQKLLLSTLRRFYRVPLQFKPPRPGGERARRIGEFPFRICEG